MLAPLVFVLATLASTASAGDDHAHSHVHSKRSSEPGWVITPPTRPLVWSDINVIHTTDTHGWLLGHQKPSSPEPNYSGDFGDFASFVSHMKKIAEEKGVDLLLVDSGDVHDGTGLSDGFPPGGIDAHDSNQFIKRLPYDILAIGNHELYIYNNTLDMHTDFVPHWNGRYLSSNVNITIPVTDLSEANPSDTRNVSVPVGNRYAKFHTSEGRRVTSLGVLFNFTGNDEGTTVQPVEEMVKEQWFAEAIEEEPDFFLLVGHMPVSQDSWPVVFNAVRAVHPETPILIFGGHTHIRDCVQLDGRSMALESGRYMETVGWMSVNVSKSSSTNNLTFSRRYLDANRLTYEFHTGRSNDTFDTAYGQELSKGLQELAERFDLNLTYGVAPRDFTISRDPYPSNGSSLSLFIEQAVPTALELNSSRAASGIPALFLTNSGSQRFDIFKGEFTKNDQITASPFTDEFVYLPSVEYGAAKQVLPILNEEGSEVTKRDFDADSGMLQRSERKGKRKRKSRARWVEELYKRGEVEMRYRAWLEDMYARRTRELERRDNASAATAGYVTTDSCPDIGDDTPHNPLPFYSSPEYIGSIVPSNITDDTPVDLVFVDFIESDVVEILNGIQGEGSFSEDSVQVYSEVLSDEVLGVYAGVAWK